MSVYQQMLPEDTQATNERMYCKKHIDTYIREAIESDTETKIKVDLGVNYLNQWLNQGTWGSGSEEHVKAKGARLAQLEGLDLRALVVSIFTQIAHCQAPETFVSVTAQMARHLGFDDRQDSITTVAEITAVLCFTDAFDITKASPQATMMVESQIPLPRELQEAIERSKYVLPMVSQPREIRSNFESPYLTFNDCQILGRGNAHADDICLDVINTQNQVALKLDLDFLKTVEEEPTHALDTVEKLQLWSQFKKESYETYYLLTKQGNRFWLTNKVDKRGRLYAQGYHVTSQGSPFKKAMLELAEGEVVEGVPTT